MACASKEQRREEESKKTRTKEKGRNAGLLECHPPSVQEEDKEGGEKYSHLPQGHVQ